MKHTLFQQIRSLLDSSQTNFHNFNMKVGILAFDPIVCILLINPRSIRNNKMVNGDNDI